MKSGRDVAVGIGRYLLLTAAALPGTLVAGVLVFALGLVIPFYIVWPLSIGSAGLAAALSAGWARNLVFGRKRHTRLPAVLRTTEATAALLVVLLFLIAPGPSDPLPIPPAVLLGGSVLLLALVAAAAAETCTAPGPVPRGEFRRSLIWLLLDLAAVVLGVLLASLFGVAGA